MITTIECTVKGMVAEKRGHYNTGGEFHRMDILVETASGHRNNVRKPLLVSFFAKGEEIHVPSPGDRISLTVSVAAQQFDHRWYNNVNALTYERIPDYESTKHDIDTE